MKVDFSKDFTKALDKLSGKIHHSVVEAINNVIDAECIEDICNCRKIESLRLRFLIERPDMRFRAIYSVLFGHSGFPMRNYYNYFYAAR